MPRLNDHFRLDFKVELLATDEDTGIMRMAFVPDPARYEWITHEGERALYDRIDRLIIPERVLAEAASPLSGLPMTFAPPHINDASKYIESRHQVIAGQLAGAAASGDVSDPSAELLGELAGNRLDFAIISADLVGSTALATTVPTEDYERIVQVLSGELAGVVPLFRGHVLKFTGDGLIAYIPGPTPNTQNDLAIDCALTMRGLVYRALNPALRAAGLPTIEMRFGIDAGEAAVVVLGNSETKRHADIIGEVVSLACKIESRGKPGDIQVGGVAARAMHTHWRELLEHVPTPSDWAYTDEYGNPYPYYRVTCP